MISIAPTSMRNKALLLGLVPAIVLSLLIGGYLINARLDDAEHSLQSRGQALANELAAISVYGLLSGDTESLEVAAGKLLSRPDIASLHIRSRHGGTVLQLGGPGFGHAPKDIHEHGRYAFESPVRGILSRDPLQRDTAEEGLDGPQAAPLGSVRVILTDRSLASLRQEILITAALLFLAGIALTGLLALTLSQRMIRPVVALSEAANRLKQGDLGARVKPQSRDEIGVLEAGFNEMAERVALTQDKLMAEVDQAVEDLQTTMDALELRNAQLEWERKRALKASQAKSDFLALISHEIRTPMNGIIGFARLLQRSGLQVRQREQVGAILDSANNLLSISNDVLDFAKLESGQVSFNPEPFRLRPLVRSVIGLFSHQASGRGIELVEYIYDDVPDVIMGDSRRIRQVLINLLSNALKFTREGRVTVRVMLDGTDTEEQITFSVQDTGIGIAPQQGDRLFKPFIQADGPTERQYGGTGLGLSISKRLVEGMQGSIGFESTQGTGSVFRFTLPLTVVEDGHVIPDRQRSDIGPVSRDPVDLSGLHILAADLDLVADAPPPSGDDRRPESSAPADPDTLPIRDPEAALRVAGGNPEVADQLFDMLLPELGQALPEIVALSEGAMWEPLRERVHQLLGACAACGVPALHATLGQLEAAVAVRDAGQTERLIERLKTGFARLNATSGP